MHKWLTSSNNVSLKEEMPNNLTILLFLPNFSVFLIYFVLLYDKTTFSHCETSDNHILNVQQLYKH